VLKTPKGPFCLLLLLLKIALLRISPSLCFLALKLPCPTTFLYHNKVSCMNLSKSTNSRFLIIFFIFKEQNYFLLPYKKVSHNRFHYISLYQLNIIFLLLFYYFYLFPISINYTFFYIKIIHREGIVDMYT